jgi:hypothetical protein
MADIGEPRRVRQVPDPETIPLPEREPERAPEKLPEKAPAKTPKKEPVPA